jgi:GT2 family glycosyltransferase
MLWGMANYPKLGVLGVVTNNIHGAAQSDRMKAKLGIVGDVGWNERPNQVEFFYGLGNQKMAKAWSNISFFCTILRQEMIDEIGDLNEEDYPMVGSDNEYNARVRCKGWLTGIMTNVFVHHDHHGTLKDVPPWWIKERE